MAHGARNVVVCDCRGAIHRGREGLDEARRALAERTDPDGEPGTADEVLEGADVFLGLSGPGAVSAAAVSRMADGAIVFATANPTPEVSPEDVSDDIAIVATGRSDYPTRSTTCSPCPVFRGALDVRASTINEETKLAAAQAIVSVIADHELDPDYIVPSAFNRDVAPRSPRRSPRRRCAAAWRAGRRPSARRPPSAHRAAHPHWPPEIFRAAPWHDCHMGRPGQRLSKLSSQILLFQVLILGGTLLVALVIAVWALQTRLDQDYQRRALGIARTVAATPEIARAVAAGDRSGIVQRRAEAVRRATGVTFVVVADRRGIRYSHPRPENVGRRVSTDPSEALAGRTVLAVETGTLGRSARARVPLRTEDGTIVGIVNVGVLSSTIRGELLDAVPVVGLFTVAALAIGLLASFLLARRLKRQTFGLELGEIAGLLQEREAALFGIREGVVAVDPDGRLRVVNGEAQRLLDLPADAIGRPVREVLGSGRLGDLLTGRLTGQDLLLMYGERVLVASRMPVRRDGRDLGAVVTLRDRTELEALARELDSVRDLTDALRAQAHEFQNRIHTISGLLQLGHHDEAIEFVKGVAQADARLQHMLGERIADPRVAALLLAKSAVATERGVVPRLAPDVHLDGELVDAPAVLSVLGNLLDNAADAAREGEARPPWVELGIESNQDGSLRIQVADSGPGVPVDLRERIFEPGYTTKPPPAIGDRGVGLSLVRRMLERRGGSLRVGEALGGGALFEVYLPDAVRPLRVEAPSEAEAVAP
jgi:two-component system CitB family sensor kinase